MAKVRLERGIIARVRRSGDIDVDEDDDET
jgi:hypothetical protein